MRPAERSRIHTFIATSDLHLERKLRIGRDDCLQAVTDGVTQARGYTDDVEFSAEDATRSDTDFLCRVVETAIAAGATTINLPDTVGYCTPEEIEEFFKDVRNRVRGADHVVFSAHCHDDLGLAVANSLAAMRAGVRQVECTINGIGERAGNASLEEIVMATRVKPDRLPYTTGIDTTQLVRTSRLLSELTQEPVQANKAIVGRNAFAHEAGIHQDGVIKDRRTYEIMTPADVGVESTLVLGKHSGRHAVKKRCEDLWSRAEPVRARPGLPRGHRAGRPPEVGQRRRRRGDRRAPAGRGAGRRRTGRRLSPGIPCMQATIALLPGDGIGPEVVAAAADVLHTVAAARGHSFSLSRSPFGAAALRAGEAPLPAATLETCLAADAVLLGAVGDPAFSEGPRERRPETGLLELRKALGRLRQPAPGARLAGTRGRGLAAARLPCGASTCSSSAS